MKKFLVYFLALLIIMANVSSCLKYKELSNISGLDMDVQGAAPLFSYELTVKDLFFKTAGYDSAQLHVDPNNKIYYWVQNVPKVNAIISNKDSLFNNIPIGMFLGVDSVSFYTSGLGSNPSIIGNDLLGPTYRFEFPKKIGGMKLNNNALSIIRLNNIVGKLKLKIANSYLFPVKIQISFPNLSGVADIIIDTLGRLATMEQEILINSSNWTGDINNVVEYEITTTIINAARKSTLDVPRETDNLELANTKIEDTFWVYRYDAIFGDVGKDRYLFKDSIRQKITITDPFILNPNNNSIFPNLNLRMDYFNHTLGIAANAKMHDVVFKMKNGVLQKVLFWNDLTNSYDKDTFMLPSKIDPLVVFNSPDPKLTSFLLDTANTDFKELSLDLRQVDSLFYNVSFYSPKDGISQDVNSFIVQSSGSGFVNSAAGTLNIPYVLSSKIFIDTSKTSVLNIPEKFYKDIENIIKDRNKEGELQEIEFSMTVENNTIFSVLPQVYFMNNNQIIDSFSNGKQSIPAARLSVSGIVRVPTRATITKKLTPDQWQQFSQCNRLTSSIFLETSPEVPFPAITNDMYVKFYFKIENIRFKYFIK